MMLDLHGPEKVTCLVRYLLAFGIITMADCEEEHAISQAFTNAYINGNERNRPWLAPEKLKIVVILGLGKWPEENTFVSSWCPSP